MVVYDVREQVVSGSHYWYVAKGTIWDVNLEDRNGPSGFLKN